MTRKSFLKSLAGIFFVDSAVKNIRAEKTEPVKYTPGKLSKPEIKPLQTVKTSEIDVTNFPYSGYVDGVTGFYCISSGYYDYWGGTGTY